MDSNKLKKYAEVAELFFYPDSSYKNKVEVIQKMLNEFYPKAGKELQGFSDFINQASQNEMEDLFTRSFEVQAITALDLGYILFGDDYKRAKLMVNLNRELNNAKIDCRNELADHLPNVLMLLPVLKEEKVVADLITDVLYQSLIKIVEDFNPKKIKMKNRIYKKHHKTIIESSDKYKLIYCNPIKALLLILEKDFGALIDSNRKSIGEVKEQTADFLSSVNTEMQIEDSQAK